MRRQRARRVRCDEAEVIGRLQRIATHPAARGLIDDVAVLDGLVMTHDSIAENVHFLSIDPPASVGWKLVAVNLSDLAAKGAEPAGALAVGGIRRRTASGTPVPERRSRRRAKATACR